MTSTQDTTRTIEAANPATGEVFGSVPVMDEAQVRQAVQRARRAQESWGALSARERGVFFKRLQDVVAANAREIAAKISRETGKPLFDALLAEVMATCELIRTLRSDGPGILADKKVSAGVLFYKKAWKSYQPYGVVGCISPWNYPFTLAMHPALTALFAGNTVVLKPSEVTPTIGETAIEMFRKAGMPDGVFEVVTGDGSTGAALVEAGVDKIHFTGSTATGKKIMAAAAESLTPITMELGGKDPMVVCEDADVERAANGAVWGAFTNSGQLCMSVERVYVPDAIYDDFTGRVIEKSKALRQGIESDADHIDIGSMISPTQLDIVADHVDDAREAGATIECGGHKRDDLPGVFYEPTVVTGVTQDMKIATEETFGPVLPIIRVKDENEAVRLANDSRYGLTASVWTRSREKGRRIADELVAGDVTINDHVVAYGVTTLPFGGMKESGFGRVHGVEGLLDFVKVKGHTEDRTPLQRELIWFPTPNGAFEFAARAAGALYRTGIIDKIRSLLGH